MMPELQCRQLQPLQTLTPDAQGQILIPSGMTATRVKEPGPRPTNVIHQFKPPSSILELRPARKRSGSGPDASTSILSNNPRQISR